MWYPGEGVGLCTNSFTIVLHTQYGLFPPRVGRSLQYILARRRTDQDARSTEVFSKNKIEREVRKGGK